MSGVFHQSSSRSKQQLVLQLVSQWLYKAKCMSGFPQSANQLADASSVNVRSSICWIHSFCGGPLSREEFISSSLHQQSDLWRSALSAQVAAYTVKPRNIHTHGRFGLSLRKHLKRKYLCKHHSNQSLLQAAELLVC
ncbi:hypothetical protein XENOCAPTIV_013526 [Xenoophorus captivus]|uniref:Uncharacterized protein n=1 Tax=Xenoophorus captivus TaxID=1517983 RepID=A0ABV0R8U9_9TELE